VKHCLPLGSSRTAIGSLLAIGTLLTWIVITLTAASARADSPQATPPSWLAQPAQSPVTAVTPTAPLRALGVLALVAIAGGVALVARKRLSGADPLPVHPRLRVLDTVRLADKSHLVLTRVGERCLLLGVTSHSVRRIAWLKFAESAAHEASGPGQNDRISQDNGAAADRDEGAVTERDGFPGLLRQAFAQDTTSAASQDDSPAALIASKTKDTVEPFTPRTTQTRATSSNASRGRAQGARGARAAAVDEPAGSLVEAQASGLAARRRR
jgi:flagellar biogenesis protein FliO